MWRLIKTKICLRVSEELLDVGVSGKKLFNVEKLFEVEKRLNIYLYKNNSL